MGNYFIDDVAGNRFLRLELMAFGLEIPVDKRHFIGLVAKSGALVAQGIEHDQI